MKDTIIVVILCSISLVVGYIEGYGEGKREVLKALNDYKNDERELKKGVTGMRLINANWFKSVMLDEPTEWMTEEQLVQFRAMVDLAPTVDAVPVTRCQDCSKWRKYDCERFGECTTTVRDTKVTRDNDYCSWSEQKDGDENG